MTSEPHPAADADLITQYTQAAEPEGDPLQGEWVLVRYAGEPIGELLPVHGEFVIGRASDAGLYLPEPEVSRRHTRVYPESESALRSRLMVEDLGSTNGTFLNGHRLGANTPQRLSSGDTLRVGRHAFKLKQLDPLERSYHETMLAQTTLDPLTGVSNRATVMSFLEKQAELSLRHRRCLSVILCDLDHFKEVNDRWGHAAGDEVLNFFGGMLQGRLRTSDQAGRIGGEEFLLVLPETHGVEAANVAENLRQCLESSQVQVPSLPEPIRITCCFGVAQLADRDGTGGGFLARADAALYRAKAEGRNRVVRDEGP